MTVVLCGSLGSTAAMWRPQACALVAAPRSVGRASGPRRRAARRRPFDVDALAGAACSTRSTGASRSSASRSAAPSACGSPPTRPERLDQLVLACTSSRFGDRRRSWHERAATVRARGARGDRRRGHRPLVHAASFRDVARCREMFRPSTAEGYARCCEALAGWDVRERPRSASRRRRWSSPAPRTRPRRRRTPTRSPRGSRVRGSR